MTHLTHREAAINRGRIKTTLARRHLTRFLAAYLHTADKRSSFCIDVGLAAWRQCSAPSY